MKIKVKPEALPWTVQVDAPGERMTSTEPLEVTMTNNNWYQLASAKWVPGWHYDIVDEPAPELPKVLWRGKVLPDDGLNVRSSRDFSDNVLLTLPKGDEVEVYEDDGTWARLDPTESMWVVKRLLAVIDNGAPNTGILDIAPIWQRDPRWINVKLGTSNTTIGSVGCLLNDITMYTNFLLGTNYTPPEMNEIIKKVGGWVHYDEVKKVYLPGGNLFRFAALWEAFPQIGADKLLRSPTIPADLTVIDAVLADKRPVIVETRINKTIQHWVLIVGINDGKYVINDPWTGTRAYFEDIYGEPSRWIYSTVSYKKVA